ncbi:MAG: SWIM zinc finger domain-containing protein [Bradymonadaceae bacterium]
MIEEEDVASWVGSTYARRGDGYQREGRVSELRKEGDQLRARCQGSQPSPYSVRVELNGDEYVASQCSCPIGGGCKHVAAVLYEYIRGEGSVPEHSPLEERLASLAPDELVDIVASYAERDPNFESWVEARLEAAGGEGGGVDREEIRARVHGIVSRAAEQQSYGRPAAFDELDDLFAIARSHLDADSPSNAAAVFAPIAEEVAERYHWFDASGGGIMDPIVQAADGLVDALERAEEPETRSQILRDLWEIFEWDIQQGGFLYGISFVHAFDDCTDDSERQTVVDWVRQSLGEYASDADDGSYSNDWRLRRLGSLVLELEGETLSESETVNLVERAGLEDWWVDELLERGEVERALETTRAQPERDRLNLADRFVEEGRPDIAEDLLTEIATSSESRAARRASSALVDFYEERERWEEAVGFALEIFEDRPGRESLQRVEELAIRSGTWEELETDLLNVLAEESPRELIWYYVEDDDPEAAVAIWESTEIRFARSDCTKFADAIAESHPDVALELFEQAVESRISSRGRGNYREACKHLVRMREILDQEGRRSEWADFRRRLREEYSNLPAFQDEMDKAGLE